MVGKISRVGSQRSAVRPARTANVCNTAVNTEDWQRKGNGGERTRKSMGKAALSPDLSLTGGV